jgi:hypothetical protein
MPMMTTTPTPAPRRLACLMAIALLGPLGCASQQPVRSGMQVIDVIPGNGPAVLPGSAPATADGAVADAAGQPPLADPWPRKVALAGTTALVYLPQVDGWQGNMLDFRAAVSLPGSGTEQQTFGVIWGSARTAIDRTTRSVTVEDLKLTRARFPTLADNGLDYLNQLRGALPAAMGSMSLDLLQGQLAAAQTVKPKSVAVSNEPPRVIVSQSPAILVPIDGSPVIRLVAGSRFERVINTQALIVRPRQGSTWYLHVYDGWLAASALDGPWLPAGEAPPGLADLARQLAGKGLVDLLDGGPKASPKPSLANGVPTIHVSQTPAELIVFKGQPNFVPITGTGLLWADNTTADVLVNTANDDYYTLLSGRWYRAQSLNGPWTFVAANSLPADFARIPKDAAAGVVLASVAGTPQGAGGADRQLDPTDGSRAAAQRPDLHAVLRRRAAMARESPAHRCSTSSMPRRRSSRSARTPITRCRPASGSPPAD